MSQLFVRYSSKSLLLHNNLNFKTNNVHRYFIVGHDSDANNDDDNDDDNFDCLTT